MHCYYGSSSDDKEACRKLTIEDYPVKCGLIEPFIIENFEISVFEMKKLRVKRCVRH